MESQIIEHEGKKKHHFWLIISVLFLAISFFLIYTSFYNPSLGNSITGNIIRGDKTEENLIEIDSTLTPPEEIKLNSKIEKIELKIEKTDKFFVGKERFDLNKASIVIDDFDGKINFNKKSITEFNGKAKKIFVEGIPITGNPDLKVYFEGEVDYNYLKLNNFYINSLAYITSGIVRLNNEKVIISLEDENFKIEKFWGDLEIRGDRFKLKGLVKESNLGFIDVKATTKENKTSKN